VRVQELLLDGKIGDAMLGVLEFGGRKYLDLRGFNLSLPLRNVKIENLDLSYLTISLAGQLSFATLRNCRLIGIDFHSNMGSHFVDADFTKSRLQRSRLRGIFEQCNFSESNMSSAEANGSSFIKCNFTNANLKKANLYSCTFSHCEFNGTYFGGGSLADSRFLGTRPTDVDLGDTIMDGSVTEPDTPSTGGK
jgi:uncharacterized protein YjbI with pentapeptide repeats